MLDPPKGLDKSELGGTFMKSGKRNCSFMSFLLFRSIADRVVSGLDQLVDLPIVCICMGHIAVKRCLLL